MLPSSEGPGANRVTLRRALGRWDLTAIGINQVVGGAIFIVPALLAAHMGQWSPIGFVLVGLISMLIALCFAELSTRFDSTGGPYLYARAAFGRFVGFEVGWLQWFTRAASQASVVNGLVVALGFYWPTLPTGPGRALLITLLTLALAAIHVRGIRQSALVVNVLTLGKLVPLAIFIGVGLFFVKWSTLIPSGVISPERWMTGGLLLIFSFGGYEVVPVPAGEATEPRRQIPFALVATILAVTAVMTLAQIVAQGTLPDVAQSKTPLADSATTFMGPAGAGMIGLASILSMTGGNAGQVLSGSRLLFALGERGDLPSWFGRIHPRFQTPSNAIAFSSAVALLLALSGSFEKLATVSALTRLVTYAATSAATLVLRHPRRSAGLKPATFSTPLGSLVPILAVIFSLAIVGGATREQWVGGLAVFFAGALLFAVRRRTSPLPLGEG